MRVYGGLVRGFVVYCGRYFLCVRVMRLQFGCLRCFWVCVLCCGDVMLGFQCCAIFVAFVLGLS